MDWNFDSGHSEPEMRRFRLKDFSILCIAALSLTLVGCNVIRVTLNTPLTPDDVAFIVPGQTTLADVINQIGAPDSITDSQAGAVATYRFLDMKYSRVNFGWLVKPWTPVDPDLVISRTGLGVDAFELFFDSRWVVTHQHFIRHVSGPRFNPYPF
jgi:hypothetical protein